MKIFTVFPLLIIPVILYNIIAFTGTSIMDAQAVRDRLNEDFLFVPMTSGATWTITPGHALICLGLLTLFFELFMSQDKAMHLAAAIWPPILGLGVLAILNLGAKYIASPNLLKPTRFVALSLGLVFVALTGRFNPGALDHHNIQIILILGSVVWLIKHQLLKHGIYSGMCAALAVAVGPEIYPFVGLIGLFVACDWAWVGEDRRNRSLGFGLGFAITLAASFVLTVRPSDWSLVYCDQLSSATVIIACLGGMGLFLSAYFFSSKRILLRLGALLIVGIFCLLFLKLFASQCLGNPLNDLPDTMHTYWLNNITEAKPCLLYTSPSPRDRG